MIPSPKCHFGIVITHAGLLVYLAIICTFHYLQMSEQKTELFANNAKDFFGQKSPFFEKN